jgi:hypothetical protein
MGDRNGQASLGMRFPPAIAQTRTRRCIAAARLSNALRTDVRERSTTVAMHLLRRALSGTNGGAVARDSVAGR